MQRSIGRLTKFDQAPRNSLRLCVNLTLIDVVCLLNFKNQMCHAPSFLTFKQKKIRGTISSLLRKAIQILMVLWLSVDVLLNASICQQDLTALENVKIILHNNFANCKKCSTAKLQPVAPFFSSALLACCSPSEYIPGLRHL